MFWVKDGAWHNCFFSLFGVIKPVCVVKTLLFLRLMEISKSDEKQQQVCKVFKLNVFFLAGQQMLLSQPTQVVQLQTPQAVPTRVVTVSTLAQDRSISVVAPVTASPVVTMTLQNSSLEDDVSFYRQKS